MPKKITDEELKNELQRLAEELDRPPRKQDMDEHGQYSATVYYDRFGSWPDAQEAAGVTKTPDTATRIPDEKLLDELRRLADDLGKHPSKNDMEEHGQYSASTYYDRYGTWSNAVEEAGIAGEYETQSPPERIPDEDLLGELRRLADELGDTPTVRDLSEHGKYNQTTYYDRYDSWGDAVEAAGLEPRSQGSRIPDDELLDELRRVADLVDRPVTTGDMAEHGKYNPMTYYNRFGSWLEATDVAGVEGELRGGSIPEDELIADLQRTAAAIDRDYVTMDAHDEHGEHGSETLSKRFGSWREALDAAGLPSEPRRDREKRYSDEEVLEELRRVADELGHAPTFSEMEDHGNYHPGLYMKRFGSWNEAKEEAGITQ